MRDWITLMTFWMTFWLTDDVGLTFQMTAGRRFTTDAAAAAANIPSYYIDDGRLMTFWNDGFDDVGRC